MEYDARALMATSIQQVLQSRLMKLKVELERESDDRWIGEIGDLPGVLAYGRTREDALAAVQALALRVIADRIENGEIKPQQADVLFEAA